MPTFRADDGVEICWEQWDGDSGQPPVLLHDGFIAGGLTNRVLPGVVDALTATGRRGHGRRPRARRSGKPHDPSFHGENRMTLDVPKLVGLPGYSMAAIVALLLATRDRRVRRLAVGAAVVELGGVDTRVIPAAYLRTAFRTGDPAAITSPAAAGFRSFADASGADRAALYVREPAVHTEPIPLGAISGSTLVPACAMTGARLALVGGDHLRAVRVPAFTAELVGFLNAGR